MQKRKVNELTIPKRKMTIINIAILMVYVAVQVFFALHHEAWRDESQAWIIARNSSFLEIFELLASEGHPCLWFLLLKGCQILGIPFHALSFISISIMAVAAAGLLWQSPFSLISKICILLSPIFFYYNSVISRVYCVVVLLLVLLCVLWPNRRKMPIAYGAVVALMFQTHILMAGFGIGCVIEMMIRNRKAKNRRGLIGLLIAIVSLVCLFFELLQTSGETYIQISKEYILSRLSSYDSALESIMIWFEYTGFYIERICFVFLASIYILYIICYIKNKEQRRQLTGPGIVSFCGVVYYMAVIICVRAVAHIQMAIIVWSITLALVWMMKTQLEGERLGPFDLETGEQQRKLKRFCYLMEIAFLVACMIVTPKIAFFDPAADINGPYSGSLEMAQLVENSVPDDSAIVLCNDELSTSMAAYLYDSSKQYFIWDISNGREYTIHKWGAPDERTIESLYDTMKADLPDRENIYFVYSISSNRNKYKNIQDDRMDLIGQNDQENIWNEYYQLYKIN